MSYTAEDVIRIAKTQVGYHEKDNASDLDSFTSKSDGKGNFTKYARDFDEKWPTFYNGKKQGFDYCEITNDWCHVMASLENGGTVDDARETLCQPIKSMGAGCTQSAAYYKAAGRWSEYPKIGAQIYFGQYDHTGIVINYDSVYVYTIEGNTSKGMVEEKVYKRRDDYVLGYGYPKYAEEEEACTTGTTGTTIKGIDISEFQTVTNWQAVKNAGIKFVLIRTGYGVTYTDSEFLNNMKGAISVGLPIGVYHFSYALNAAGAKAEAERVISLLAPYKQHITLPVYFDFEGDTVSYAKKQGVTLGKQAFNDHTVAFCEAIKAAGYRPGTYFNLSYYDNWVDKSRLGGYNRWFAQYNSTAQCDWYDVWQYSSSGSVNGISGKVDMNVADASFVNGGSPTYEEGWKKNDKGWWYQNADGTWPAGKWASIGSELYYFGPEGYCVTDQWVKGTGDYSAWTYYVGSDGKVAKNRTLKLDGEGKLIPAGGYYYYIKEVPASYRETLDKLVAKEVLKGKGGTGEDLILDMSEDAVRTLVLLNRAGAFG